MIKLNKRILAIVLALALVPLTYIGLSTGPSSAVEEVDPERIWDVANAAPSNHTGSIRAIVYDLQELNGKMYVGGKFLNVVEPNRKKEHDQAFLAAFDLRTGAWDKTFRPKLDGPVYSLALRADGKLLAGGELTGGIAAIDPTTGALDKTFKPQIKNSWGKPAVFDIEVDGNALYAGGTFAKAQGVAVDRLGKFNVTTGKVDTKWRPTTQFDTGTPKSGGEVVYGLAVDKVRNRVYAVGKFGGINNNSEAAYLAILDRTNGQLKDVPQGLPANIMNHREGWSMWQHDVQLHGDKVIVGGQGHQTFVMNADTFKPSSSFFTGRGIGDIYNGGGDTQVIYVGKNTIWSGCHCWDSVGPYPIGVHNNENPNGQQTIDEYWRWLGEFRNTNPYGQQSVKGVYGVDLETQELLPLKFDLSGSAGAWALYEDSLGQLWAGGEFTSGGGVKLSGLARFTSEATGVEPGPIEVPGNPPVAEPAVPVAPTPAKPLPPAISPVKQQPTPTGDCRTGANTAMYNVDDATNAGIYRLYCAYFVRYPDVAGFNYWVNAVKLGYDLREVASFFEQTPEYTARHGSKENAAFVEWVYASVLKRPSDNEGKAYWLGELNAGLSRSDMVFYFSDSVEFKKRTKTL